MEQTCAIVLIDEELGVVVDLDESRARWSRRRHHVGEDRGVEEEHHADDDGDEREEGQRDGTRRGAGGHGGRATRCDGEQRMKRMPLPRSSDCNVSTTTLDGWNGSLFDYSFRYLELVSG